jgi:hypothetical protein
LLPCGGITASTVKDPRLAIGRSPDRPTLVERIRFAGKTVALEIYTPETIPLRRLEAIGDSMEEWVRILKDRGLDPAGFEYTRLAPPY